MILMRKTSLRSNAMTSFGVKGLYVAEVPRTEDGILIDGIEILTRNVKHIKAIPDSIVLQDKNIDVDYFTRTDIGPLVLTDKEIVQLNSKGEQIASVDKDLYTAMKIISTSKFKPEPLTMKQNVIELMEDYGLIKRNLIPDEVPLIAQIDGRVLNSLGKDRVFFCSNFNEIKKSIPHYYTTKPLDTFISTIIKTGACLVVNEINKVFVINNVLYSVRNMGETLSVELMGWE